MAVKKFEEVWKMLSQMPKLLEILQKPMVLSCQMTKSWLVKQILWVSVGMTSTDIETISPIFPSELANCSASLLTRSSGLNKLIKNHQPIPIWHWRWSFFGWLIDSWRFWKAMSNGPRRKGNMENFNKVALFHLSSWIFLTDFGEVPFCHLKAGRRCTLGLSTYYVSRRRGGRG